MPDKLKIDYDVLNDAKTDLENLASGIGPLFDTGLFAQLGGGDGTSVLGDAGLASALSSFYYNAQSTMTRADKGIKELAGAFGSVGEAFLSFDSELAQGMGITGSNLALQNYYRDKDLWDYKQKHMDQCVPGPDGSMPDFCSATDPGQPPLDQNIKTERGEVHTHLTVDDKGNVIKEESTVTYDGKTYTSVTNYSNDGRSYTTDTSYPDGSKVHSETNLNTDGSGSMVVTNSDGDKTEYTRGPKGTDGKQPDWVQVGGNDPDDGDGGGGHQPPPRPTGGGSGGGTRPSIA
ncbi:hypothetical protein ABZ883_33940 [Streptomyces sp. NPDC046977]|uniref:hypothetical protein n=1 Tax=Streptomyces sp. NPDC046977 TaxID=3154703 RepID=UPI0033C315AE